VIDHSSRQWKTRDLGLQSYSLHRGPVKILWILTRSVQEIEAGGRKKAGLTFEDLSGNRPRKLQKTNISIFNHDAHETKSVLEASNQHQQFNSIQHEQHTPFLRSQHTNRLNTHTHDRYIQRREARLACRIVGVAALERSEVVTGSEQL
jgi:hypothetical protein